MTLFSHKKACHNTVPYFFAIRHPSHLAPPPLGLPVHGGRGCGLPLLGEGALHGGRRAGILGRNKVE